MARHKAGRNSKWWSAPLKTLCAGALLLCAVSTASSETGISDDRILFGQSAALDGPAASLGTAFRDGLRAAFDEINRSGGVNGRRLALISYDDGYEPGRSIENTNRLIREDKVFALVGEVGTPTSRAAQPIAEKTGVPFIGPFTGAAFLRNPALATVVNIRASYDQEAEALVEYLSASLGLSRIAVLHQDDTFGRTGLAGILAALHRRGMSLVADGTYRRNTTAVKQALLSIRRADPQAVIIVGAYKPTAVFIKTADRIGMDAVFAALSFVGGKALAAELGPTDETVLISQVVPLFDDPESTLVRRFQTALAESSPEAETSFVALEGYITGRLMIDALMRLGTEPTRQDFLDLFATTNVFDIDGLELDYGAGDNQGSDQVFLTTIEPDGTFTAVEPDK